MKHRFFIRLVLLVLSILHLPAVGQEVAFRAICISYQEGIRSVYCASGKGGNQEVALYTGSIGEVHQAVFENGVASFYVEDSSVAGGKRVVAAGKLASGSRQFFLVVPNEDKEMPYKILCMADDVRSFPMGGVRYVNLTPYPSRLTLAGAVLPAVKPGGMQTYPKVVKVNDWNMYQAVIELQAPNGKWASISSPGWKALETKRDLVVVTIDGRSKQPKIYNFKDLPPWLEPVDPGEPE
ncbi:hypothetical protein HNR46_000612 [Haloferula luteola]|uniref:DUF4397 domain-containing protein n=1 Tax=Haloferula luteola TaxID=595692 RepID=A0A840V6J0_9BACT|nr:hypothetical protein [Haloferula luteola]MBB5350388.1 hypothetical protein [Haloferula luteola]